MMNIAQRQIAGKKLIASPEIELYFFVRDIILSEKWYVVSLKFVFLETLFYTFFTINVFE